MPGEGLSRPRSLGKLELKALLAPEAGPEVPGVALSLMPWPIHQGRHCLFKSGPTAMNMPVR